VADILSHGVPPLGLAHALVSVYVGNLSRKYAIFSVYPGRRIAAIG
jgi:hypothetical protein